MRKPTPAEAPIRTIADPRYARYQVGHLAYYCLRPGCADARWPCGSCKLLTADHFTYDGQCKNATKGTP